MEPPGPACMEANASNANEDKISTVISFAHLR